MFIATFCDHARSNRASGNGSARADPCRKSTRLVHKARQPGRGANELRRQIDAADPAAIRRRQIARRPANPRTDVDHMIRGHRRQHPRQFLGRQAAARVELVHQAQVVDRQLVDMLSGQRQCLQNAIEQTVGTVMNGDVVGRARSGHGGASAVENDPPPV
jgi:hypothetical protein